MLDRSSTAAVAVALAAALTIGGALAADDAKYPNWKGQWNRVIVPAWGAREPSIRPALGARTASPADPGVSEDL